MSRRTQRGQVQPTPVKLARALREAGAPREMVARARSGWYDDFLSPLATPQIQLLQDAAAHELWGIVNRSRLGDFNATAEEADAWAASADGQAAIKALYEGKGGHE